MAEHERDALIGAVAAREGSLRCWKLDLSQHLGLSEIDPKATWFGEVHYWWPAETLGISATVSPKLNASANYSFKPRASSEIDIKVCPECRHVFRGKGWEGIDAHWKAKHEHLLPYQEAWPRILAGEYKSTGRR
jgi:hypothetical protein